MTCVATNSTKFGLRIPGRRGCRARSHLRRAVRRHRRRHHAHHRHRSQHRRSILHDEPLLRLRSQCLQRGRHSQTGSRLRRHLDVASPPRQDMSQPRRPQCHALQLPLASPRTRQRAPSAPWTASWAAAPHAEVEARAASAHGAVWCEVGAASSATYAPPWAAMPVASSPRGSRAACSRTWVRIRSCSCCGHVEGQPKVKA